MKIEKFETEGMQYAIRYPKDYTEGEKYPVIMLLHGSGSRGQDIDKLFKNPFFTLTEQLEYFPFVTVAPLCSEDTWYDMMERLRRLVISVTQMPFVDSERIYLMGSSMGGYGVWQLAMSMPEYFAAIVPICGGGQYPSAARLQHVPVWAFHGGKDRLVLPEESEKMCDRVNRAGGNARLTIYPDNAHDAWSDTYSNPEVFAWLLSHRRANLAAGGEKFDDPKLFG